MNKVYIPEGYSPALGSYDTQRAIEFIKDNFQKSLSENLSLKRVSAPLFVTAQSGLNDNLSGKERPVSFDIPAVEGEGQVVHSLAKWKRLALKRYGFVMHRGLFTDMNAIRRDEELDNLHSIYVDQWDWEKIISAEDRTTEYLYATVESIVSAICDTCDKLKQKYPVLNTSLSRKVAFITSDELEEMYPTLTPDEREHEYTRIHRTVFVSRIGAPLKNGKPHGMRAPDYDDWSLNGDILFWHDALDTHIEISSMGIRVDPDSLDKQLSFSGCDDRRALPFHSMLLNGELPLTIGGGIGQSRLCLLMLGNVHIGEVQSSVWDSETIRVCAEKGVPLL